MELTIINTITSSIYLFFLPGFAVSLILFKWGTIIFLERVIFSFVLSITIVPLALFYGNLFGIPVTTINVISHIIFLIATCLVIFFFQNKRELL